VQYHIATSYAEEDTCALSRCYLICGGGYVCIITLLPHMRRRIHVHYHVATSYAEEDTCALSHGYLPVALVLGLAQLLHLEHLDQHRLHLILQPVSKET